MRVYLPSTLPRLGAAVAGGEVGPAPLTGCAVTPALREWYVEGDLEELEYAALTAAAALSLRLLAEDAAAASPRPLAEDAAAASPRLLTEDDPLRRRVVLAADVPDPSVEPATADPGSADRAVVRVTVAVPLARLAAVHVDDPAAIAAVGSALAALAAADRGDADAEFLLEEAASHELQWYASSEITELVR